MQNDSHPSKADPADWVIRAQGLGKAYPIHETPFERLAHALFPSHSASAKAYWALRGVSLLVAKGESVGIIGRNGSGKSTLLQLITGTLSPTEGQVEAQGTVGALLELGAGFDTGLTGRQNVYLNGLLSGHAREAITARLSDIEAFAELGEFFDQPIKEYSSGMVVRLAFAIQTAFVPEVLIVDEALSVGDFFFQQKCLRRIRELKAQGTALLFVSHDMAIVRDLCERTIYLRHGEVAYAGDSSEAIWHFLQERSQAAAPAPQAVPAVGAAFDRLPENVYWTNPDTADAVQPATILGVALHDAAGHPALKARMGDELIFRIYMRSNWDGDFDAGIEVKNRYDQIVTSNGSYTLGVPPCPLRASEIGVFEMKMRCMFEAGQYTFQVSVGTGEHKPNQGMPVTISPWLGPIAIAWDYSAERAPFLGMFGAPVSARFFKPASS